jgi:lauroyl/myristoyl acyltransferase
VRLHRPEIIAGARRNLAIHRPDLGEEEIRAFIWRFLDNVGRFMSEFSVLTRIHTEGRVELLGAAPVQAIHGTVPILTIVLHTGNWEVFGLALRDANLPVATFYETPPRAAQQRIVVEMRHKIGFQLLDPSPRGMRDAIALLKRNHIVAIFGDEARKGHLMAPLFGRPPHDRGNLALAVRLARRNGAKIVIAHSERLEGCRFRMHISPPFSLPEDDSGVVADVAFLNERIEPIILANLDRWYYLDDSLAPVEAGKA